MNPPIPPAQPNDLAMMDSSAPAFEIPVMLQIPVDLFISREHHGLTRGELTLTDAYGNLVYTVDGRSSKSTPRNSRVLLDPRGDPIISIHRDDGGWQGFRGDGGDWKELVFRVETTLYSRRRTELEVFLVRENCGDSSSDFKMKGCPFQRSCTIYKGNSIVAQSSLMYKLGKIIVGRRRFRLTIFPGFVDHALVVALVVIFCDGRN